MTTKRIETPNAATSKNDEVAPQSVATAPTTVTAGRVFAGMVLSVMIGSGSFAIPPTDDPMRRRRQGIILSSTALTERDPELISEARDLFERGATEFFQDGMESSFSHQLLLFVETHGPKAFEAIGEYVFARDAAPDVVAEALRWLIVAR
jgi:hypothetical protein